MKTSQKRAEPRATEVRGTSVALTGVRESAAGASGVSASPTNGIPSALLRYQQELVDLAMKRETVVVEKSRRIGATWGIAAAAVLTAAADRQAGGMKVFYLGYNLEMTREFIDACAMWAKAFAVAARAVEELVFVERDDEGEQSIKAFRIDFGSGFEIVALPSRPRSLRGRQGFIIVDEAAFHDDLAELLKAAMAMLIWGGRVLVISTHDGVENPFNELIEDVRAGRRKNITLVRTTFDDALRDGLYQRICLTKGTEWSAEAEATWAKGIRDSYGDAAGEELDCIPRQSGGRYLARTMLEGRAVDVPVLRWRCNAGFVDLSDEPRTIAARTFCEEQIAPLLANLDGATRSFVGEDFGRSGDLTVLWPLLVSQSLERRTPFVIELRNVPFRQQEQILFWLIDALPRFGGVALDARGNGQYLAEVTRQRYGAQAVAEVMLAEAWYREHMPPMKAALEDGTLSIPRDADIVDDLRSLEVVRGVARVPERSTKRDGEQRHGDSAIALVLALFASRTIESGPLEWTIDHSRRVSLEAFSGGLVPDPRNLAGWNLS